MADITTGLQVYFTLDEGSGTTVNDLSGNGNNGTLTGTSTWTGTAQVGGGVTFASNGYITVPDAPSLGGYTACTIACWVNRSLSGSRITILSKGASSSPLDNSFYLENTTSNTARVVMSDSSDHAVASASSVSSGVFHHLMAVYDGSAITLYVDNVATGTPATWSGGTVNNTTEDFSVGAHSNDHLFKFSGTVDEVRIYNRALDATDRAALYAYTGAIVAARSSMLLLGAG